MDAFQKALDSVIKVLRLVGALALVLMMLITCADVLFRGFDHPIIWAVDTVGFMAVLALACAMPYTQVEGGHVGVDLLVLKMSPRGQAIIDSITASVSTVLFGVISWQMWRYASELASKGEVSMTVQIPKSPFIYAVSACFGILCVVLFTEVIRNIGKAVKE
jgi:TRAP-type C4-dicarboxylate transport system permease small subunit